MSPGIHARKPMHDNTLVLDHPHTLWYISSTIAASLGAASTLNNRTAWQTRQPYPLAGVRGTTSARPVRHRTLPFLPPTLPLRCHILPDLAALAAHNAKCQVHESGKPA